MKRTRKIIVAILTIILANVFTITAYAASSSIAVSANRTSVVVGNTFNLTVSVSASGDKLGTWEYSLNFDSSLFKLMSGTNPVVDYGDGSKTRVTYSYTVKALKSGSGTIGVKSYNVIGWNSEGSLNPSASGVIIKCMTQAEIEATYSANANLKGITVEGYELTPEFNKDTLEYTLELENNVTMINVGATKEDARSNVTGIGEIPLLEGPNRLEIIVTAQKGNTKTYVINANVKELDPVVIKVDGTEYRIIRKADQLDSFSSFQPQTIVYEDNEIPVLYNEITKYTLVGVKDEAGSKLYFIYNSKLNTFIRYQEIKFGGVVFYPLGTDKKPAYDKYQATTITINGVKVAAYKLSKNSEFALIYGINMEDGQEDFYLYDSVGETIQRYNSEEQELFNKDLKDYLLVIGAFGIGLILSFSLVFAMLLTKAKNKKKKNLKEITVESNSIVKEAVKSEEKDVKRKDLKKANEIKEAKEKLAEIKQKVENTKSNLE